MSFNSKVESFFFNKQSNQLLNTKTKYIRVDNFPKLGLLTSLRFLEWADANPKGVISLPTGKTPEHFIKWTKFFLDNWNDEKAIKFREENGLLLEKKPYLRGLHFVQIDEFYPISPKQLNSFYDYVVKYYIDGFGLDKSKALLINCENIPLYQDKHFTEIFPNSKVDLSLRYREPESQIEIEQKDSILKIDQWCNEYEDKIRNLGGIGFFLGGIGPDGHIAFNIQGSDHNSTTRLTPTNFPTQAVAASDLGGIQVSRNRLVITIGLQSITFNPETVAIIFAAGEAKAQVIKNALERSPNVLYPATSLQKLPNARFYITQGAAVALEDSIEYFYKNGEWTKEKTERALIDMIIRIDKYGYNIKLEDLKNDKYTKLIPNVSIENVNELIESVKNKIGIGMSLASEKRFYHTGPHHDDIQLAILPKIVHDVRSSSNEFNFAIMTSGFTAVTNQFIEEYLKTTLNLIETGQIGMIYYQDFFNTGYKFKFDKDINYFLNKIADQNIDGQKRAVAHRIVRIFVIIYKLKSIAQLIKKITEVIEEIKNSYDGEKNSPEVQELKGMIREFEEELVWAHYGIQTKNIHHLRLGFYKGDIFTEVPKRERDVIPILEQLRELKPNVISLAFDPEGSGPDTHYKVLQAIAEAIKLWRKEKGYKELKIIGYRNVWYKFHPADANVYVPISLNTMAELDDSFSTCYMTQVDAPFPSYELDGKFSTLTQSIWVEQRKIIQLILGKNYFFQNENPRIRGTHGFLFYKEMEVDEFLSHARDLANMMEGVI